jgi:competence protein ComEC
MLRVMGGRLGVGLLAFAVGIFSCADDPGGGSDAGSSSGPSTSTQPTTTAGPSSSSEASSEGMSTSNGSTTDEPATTGSTSGEGSSSTGAEVEGTLVIYWIDTEGGAATLLVTPGGPLVLVDTGNPGDRDADRIADVVQNVVGTDTIDVVLITHYHGDHVGGVPELAERVNITEFWDHGENVEACGADCPEIWDAYQAVAEGKRTTIAVGDTREVGGVELQFVAADQQLIAEPLTDGAPNPACKGAAKMPPTQDENTQSVGFVASFGAFDFLDLGDLYWFEEHDLVCPNNLLGEIDLYQTTHHGLGSSGATELVHAIAPVVVVMNNGATKGGAPESFDSVFTAPGAPDLWQLHLAVNNDEQHNSEDDLVANFEEGDADPGHWVRATIDGPTGMITLHNARNAHERSYAAR